MALVQARLRNSLLYVVLLMIRSQASHVLLPDLSKAGRKPHQKLNIIQNNFCYCMLLGFFASNCPISCFINI